MNMSKSEGGESRLMRDKLLPRWTDPEEVSGYRVQVQEDTTIGATDRITPSNSLKYCFPGPNPKAHS